jgi:hypothetical protein
MIGSSRHPRHTRLDARSTTRPKTRCVDMRACTVLYQTHTILPCYAFLCRTHVQWVCCRRMLRSCAARWPRPRQQLSRPTNHITRACWAWRLVACSGSKRRYCAKLGCCVCMTNRVLHSNERMCCSKGLRRSESTLLARSCGYTQTCCLWHMSTTTRYARPASYF